MMNTELNFIGTIETPYHSTDECPSNITPEDGSLCTINLFDEFKEGTLGLSAGDEILVLYWLDKTDRTKVVQTSRHDKTLKGTFALRSPHRPNPIGAAVVEIQEISDGEIKVIGLDCLNGTHLIDIKPAIRKEKS